MDASNHKWNQSVRISAWAILTVGLFFAAYAVVANHAPHLIRKSRVFHFYMRKASGVEVGTPVWVKGVEAGKVTSMAPAMVPATLVGGTPLEGKIFAVNVTCRVFTPYHRLIRDGSKVEVLLLSVLGRPRVDVFPGEPGSPRAPDGAILAQRVTRGTEGEVEQLLDAGERMDGHRKEMAYFIDEIEKNTDEINESYKSGRSSLYALVDKKADRTALKDLGASLEATAAASKVNTAEIECNAKCLDKELAARLEEELKATARDFKATAENILGLIRGFKEVIKVGEKTSDNASGVSKKVRAFNDKFRVLLIAQTVYIPGILADWSCISDLLVSRGIMKMRMMVLPKPGVEEILRFIYRGRLKVVRRDPKTGEPLQEQAAPDRGMEEPGSMK